MMQMIGPTKQTQKQKEYCKQLGIKDINKVKISWYSRCPYCGKVDSGEEEEHITLTSAEESSK